MSIELGMLLLGVAIGITLMSIIWVIWWRKAQLE